jgi:DnaD/phage-associated family protein
MTYRFLPFGDVWDGGIFNAPVSLVDKYIKLASEYQLKALLYILRNGGQADSAQIAKALGQTQGDIDDLLEFWSAEGVLSTDGAQVQTAPAEKPLKAETPAEEKPVKKETLSAPRLSPKDIVVILRENEELQFLLTHAQTVLGRTISHAEQEMLINMSQYYGLRPEIVLTILEFYRAEKERGKSIGIAYVNSMAKNWAEEGIDNLADAEEKLKAIESSNRLWNEVVAITGIRHRYPTVKQREMIAEWFETFDVTMVTLAADIMKENTSEPKLQYMNTILKKWKKQGITSPLEVQEQQEAFEKSKQNKKDGRLQVKPTYDLEKVKKDAMDNTDI